MILFNKRPITFGHFPNGESYPENGNYVMVSNNEITLQYESDNDLVHLMFIKKHLDQLNKHCRHKMQTILVITYMPYSRQDRVEGESFFTLRHTCDFINSLDFSKVIVLEPHSEVTSALLDRVESVDVTSILVGMEKKRIGFIDEVDAIFYPDAGAQKRYAKKIPAQNVLVGFKQRDFQTGRIDSLQILGKDDFVPRKVIIADDLCSYGGTFLRAAQELKKLGAQEIYLAVAHCEAGVFKGDLYKSGLIDGIATSNSMPAFHNAFSLISQKELRVYFTIFDVIIGGQAFAEDYLSSHLAV